MKLPLTSSSSCSTSFDCEHISNVFIIIINFCSDVNNLFYFDETVCDLLYSNFIQNHVLFYNNYKTIIVLNLIRVFQDFRSLALSVGKFTVNKILEASLNFNRKVMSLKSAIQQKKGIS